MKVNNFQGDLTDISAKKEALFLVHEALCAISEMCSAQQCAAIHCIVVPFHFHTAEEKPKSWWLKISY